MIDGPEEVLIAVKKITPRPGPTMVQTLESTVSFGASGSRRLAWHIVKTSLPRPAKPRQAMPGPDPPRHAKPRREIFNRRTPPSSSIPQLGHLLDVEPPVEAGLLRPPVAEPDAAAARGQPRRQLVAVHQLRVDIGDADD